MGKYAIYGCIRVPFSLPDMFMKAITAGRTNTVSSYLPAFHCLERSGPRSCEKIRQPPLNQPITQGCKGPQIGTFT